MVILANFPMVSQLTQITEDGTPSNNSAFDCVAASIGAAILYYQGKTAWDTAINPDMLKDAAYSEGYTGGTSAEAYIPICEKLGYTLFEISDTPANLVQHIHQQLDTGRPVIVTVPDVYVAASLNWSHVLCMYGELGTGLLAMDPYPLPGTSTGHTIHNSDAQWAALLEFNSIWVLMKAAPKEVEVVIDLSMPEVASFYSAGPGVGQWTCKTANPQGKCCTVQGAILAEYCRYGGAGLCGLTFLGLPFSSEIAITPGVVKQFFERGVLCYDPNHTIDFPPGAGSVYPLHLYGGPGEDPAVAQQAALIKTLQAQGAQSAPATSTAYPAAIATIRAAIAPLP